tara:strand:+ start:1577 stop:2065 length:489 start_codon:yes stop_codon:yes gene_type:complete
MMENERYVINCPLCDTKELQIMKNTSEELMQCISCGYSTSKHLSGNMKDNLEFNKMDDEIKYFAKQVDNQIWIPSVVNLSIGILYPINKGDELTWTFSPLVNVSDEEKENYKKDDGTYYNKRYDMENEIYFESFSKAIFEINLITNLRNKNEQKIKDTGKTS